MSIKDVWTNMKTWQKIVAVVLAIMAIFVALLVVKIIVFALIKSIAFWLILIIAGAIMFYTKKKKITLT